MVKNKIKAAVITGVEIPVRSISKRVGGPLRRAKAHVGETYRANVAFQNEQAQIRSTQKVAKAKAVEVVTKVMEMAS